MHSSNNSKSEIFLNQGHEAMQIGKFEEALKNYMIAVTMQEDNYIAWGNMGACYNNLDESEKALECFNKALYYNPTYKHAWNNKGMVLARSKQLEEALECFNNALEIDPSHTNASENRLTVLKELGRIEVLQADELKIINRDGKYYLLAGKEVLKTPKGNVIESETETLFKNIITDFEGQGDLLVDHGIIIKPRVVSAYVFASTKSEFMDKGDDLSHGLLGWLQSDPFFEPTAGHPTVSMYQENQQRNVMLFLQEKGIETLHERRYKDEDKDKIINIFVKTALDLNARQKSVLVNLAWPNGGQFVFTIVYLLGKYSEREWATAIFSRTPDVCRIIGDEPMGGMFSMQDELGDEEREELIESIIKGYEDECNVAKRYLEITK